MSRIFKDRADAGRQLASALAEFKGNDNTLILALPRGGVPVAYEIAKSLSLPLDVLPVRKLGVPGQEELAMGSIAGDGIIYLNEPLIDQLRINEKDIEDVIAKEQAELKRRYQTYRPNQPPLQLEGKTIILVDDGAATGATLKAAIEALRASGVHSIVTAIPVGAPSTCDHLQQLTDQFICLSIPDSFLAVGQWYRHFPQNSDKEVLSLLNF